MKKSTHLLRLWSGAALLLLAVGAAYSQSANSKPEATGQANTNNSPGNSSSQLVPSASHSLATVSNAQPGEITTLDGKIYKGVTVQKADPDGLRIQYRPVGGGMGAAKIKFKNLPANLQQQYKYDPAAAAAYETQQARGAAAWQAQREAQAKLARQKAAQRAQQDEIERQKKEMMEQQKKEAPKEMTEQEKQQAQREIEGTWSGMKAAVQAGRITN